MEVVKIENDKFIAHINAFGAEPSRLYDKSSKTDLLWDAQKEFWGRHAPVLFPTVGKLKDGYFLHKNQKFELGQHGFARDLTWQLEESKKDSCRFSLTSSTQTLARFPFHFKLTLDAHVSKEGLELVYTVENPGESDLLFSIGTHPAFHLPWSAGKSIKDYQVVFQKNETAEILNLSKEGLRTGKRQAFLNEERRIILSEELFKNDALVFDDLNSQSLKVEEIESGKGFEVSWNNFPHLGIWKPIGAPFICIEPWYGMADEVNSTHQLSEKFGIIRLTAGKVSQHSYAISPCLT